MFEADREQLAIRHDLTPEGTETELNELLPEYKIHEELARGKLSVVYLSTCMKGRLRNRLIALRKKHHNPSTSPDEVLRAEIAASIHQAIYHPSILSLHAFIATPSASYHVLEYCSNDSLRSVLRTRPSLMLSEDELRGVVTSIVHALIYLRQELILHRNIKPSNIYFNGEGRLKLSGFDLAHRLSSIDSTATSFCGSPQYMSPEVVSGMPYSFPTDLWSLGCVIVTCLTGAPAFTEPELHEKITSGTYTLPRVLSYEARDLISAFLQVSPGDRVPLHRTLGHPFFNPSHPTTPIKFPLRDKAPQVVSSVISEETVRSKPSSSRVSQYPGSLSKDSSTLRPPSRFSSLPTLGIQNRKPLSAIGSHSSRTPSSRSMQAPSTRRISSAPVSPALHNPVRKPLLSPFDSQSSTPSLMSDSSLVGSNDLPVKACPSGYCELDVELSQHALLDYPSARISSRSSAKRLGTRLADSENIPPVVSNHRPTPPVVYTQLYTEDIPRREDTNSQPISAVPIGTTRPVALNTLCLIPQTHKLAQGQITVLPSLALLVDFREGERRKGRKGVEVLVISPDGDKIDVYSAPHLSTPCCLTEPIAVYSLDHLPVIYWKLYNDGCSVIQQIKSRIPKLILHKPDAKCTLMANEPLGDIEILSPPVNVSSKHPFKDNQAVLPIKTTTRMRLLRRSGTLEISRYLPTSSHSGPLTGEWTKKVIRLTNHSEWISSKDHKGLDSNESNLLHILEHFLQVCAAAEQCENSENASRSPSRTGPSSSGISKSKDGRTLLRPLLPSPPVHQTNVDDDVTIRDKSTSHDTKSYSSAGATVSTTMFTEMNVPRRPFRIPP
ncbi:unnamed protein product [Somion occarium]|uniref:Serine/threonine protein kinase n=2 Tax=Somion occarium TaxID=3059160 RepID=A0ABP1DZJ5_9APHY